MKYATILIFAGLTFVFLSSCSVDSSDNHNFTFGTVKYIELEGGFFGIETDGGEKFNPVNLEEKYRRDGLNIVFKYQEAEEQMSIQMWGKLIEITEIKLVE